MRTSATKSSRSHIGLRYACRPARSPAPSVQPGLGAGRVLHHGPGQDARVLVPGAGPSRGRRNWLRIDQGAVRLTEWIPGVHDELSRWTLWSKGKGVVSHESTLAEHELGDFESAYVHLTAPPGSRIRDSAVVLHQADLAGIDIVQRTGYRVTSVVRSIVDVHAATGVDAAQLNRAIHEAQERGVLAFGDLRDHAEAVDPRIAPRIERALSGAEGE